jgi:hypothetical protein
VCVTRKATCLRAKQGSKRPVPAAAQVWGVPSSKALWAALPYTSQTSAFQSARSMNAVLSLCALSGWHRSKPYSVKALCSRSFVV